MKAQAFPACCTGKLICHLEDGTHVAHEGYYNGNDLGAMTEQTLINYLRDARTQGYAFVAATTNDSQKNANKLLRKLGFKSSSWMTKSTHPDTKVKIWWFALNDGKQEFMK